MLRCDGVSLPGVSRFVAALAGGFPAVATLANERTLVLYVRDSTKQLYYTFSDEIGEPDNLIDFGEGFTVKSIALARAWKSLGLEPSAVIGHSQGEIAAAVVAGLATFIYLYGRNQNDDEL